MQRFPIYYPKGAGFEGAVSRALRAAIVNIGGIFITASVVNTIQSRSLGWLLDVRVWAYFAAVLAVFWCIGLLYERRCKRRREARGRGYRHDLQMRALKQNQNE
jgi:hypothetical protein